MRVSVVVHPRSSRARLEWDGDQLQLWVTHPPVANAANAAVIRAVSDWLGVPRSAVHLVAGLHGRRKLVDVEGVTALPG